MVMESKGCSSIIETWRNMSGIEKFIETFFGVLRPGYKGEYTIAANTIQ